MKHISQPPPVIVGVDLAAPTRRIARITADQQLGSGGAQ
jgi:hypothetical protein